MFISLLVYFNFVVMEKKKMLEDLISYYSHGNKARFAAKLGISPQALSMWIARKSFDAELIYTKCENISAAWLFSGEGNMIEEQVTKISLYNGDKQFYQIQISNLMEQIKKLSEKNSELEKALLEFLKKDIQYVETPKSKNVG